MHEIRPKVLALDSGCANISISFRYSLRNLFPTIFTFPGEDLGDGILFATMSLKIKRPFSMG